jgi:hypothetical protein
MEKDEIPNRQSIRMKGVPDIGKNSAALSMFGRIR